jgi:ribulose-5-phosphate 4-epimerase/fuculose-1-phosphate aldolase
MNLDEARTEICRVGASLFTRGYVHGTTGNISVRLADGYLITPTDACLGELHPAALAFVDPDGVHVDGEPASKAIALHRSIYDADNSARCIIHTHSREVVAASFEEREPEDDLLPPITPYQVMKVGSTPVLHYSAPGSAATAEHVGRLVARRIRDHRPVRSLVLARLGPNVWHGTPLRAMAVLEELEETALLWNRLHPSSLPAAAMKDLAERFRAAW